MIAEKSTLCLSLASGESVLVGDTLIRIRKSGRGRVTIAIQSPKSTKIFSERVLRKILDSVQLQSFLDEHFPMAVSRPVGDSRQGKHRRVA